MKFVLRDTRYARLDPSIKREIAEKLFAAEKNIAILRFMIVLLNVTVYTFLMSKNNSIEWLAYSLMILAFIYSAFVLLFHPYKKYHLLLTSYFTSGTDAFLITLWIIATGGYESTFYVLWYASILGIAMRYTMPVTIRVAILYSVLYFAILYNDIHIMDHIDEVCIRLGYLFFIAIVGGMMAQEVIDQIEAKIIIKKSEEEIKKRELLLKEAHDKLDERVKERTRELDETNQQLIKINEDIDHFVYSASHDLKSPVLNLEALLNILYEEHEPQCALEKDIRERVDKSIEKMKQTINNLAEVAKTQKEVYDDVSELNFEEVLKDVIAENEEIIKKANATIISDFKAAGLTCSKTCLKSIIYNLLSNAIKYRSPQRNPIVEFKTEISQDCLCLLIKDNGLGIDLDKNKQKLFSIFKRFHDHVEGAGIGLYTVKKMVEKFEGNIDVESEPGVGTTFRINFKARKDYSASM